MSNWLKFIQVVSEESENTVLLNPDPAASGRNFKLLLSLLMKTLKY